MHHYKHTLQNSIANHEQDRCPHFLDILFLFSIVAHFSITLPLIVRFDIYITQLKRLKLFYISDICFDFERKRILKFGTC